MHRFRSFHSSIGNALSALLLFALLSAQWAGLQHRVEHAQLEAATARISAINGNDGGTHAAHSCQLFDAAALGASLHTPFLAAPCVRMRIAPAVRTPILSWQALFVGHFLSRAPPAF
jgi:hypothetical protein